MTALSRFSRTLRFGCVALTLATNAAQADMQLANEEEKTLYLLGTAVARTLVAFNLSEGELAIVMRAVEDALLERPPLVDIPQAGDRVQALHAKRVSTAAAIERAESEAYLESQASAKGAVHKDSGLIITEISPGDGASPGATDTVTVHYHGTLRDGTVFDSSVDRGEPATFPLDRVIPCWTEGVALMKVGGKSRLVCPPSIAYGDPGRPPVIPGGAALSFEVELIKID